MAGPMPPQGPQGGPPPGPGPGAQPPGPPPAQTPVPGPDPEGQSPAMKAVSMAHDGLAQLGAIFEKSKGEVSPEEQKQLAGIIQSFEALVHSLSGEGGQGQPPAAKPPGGPIPAMAGKGSTPLDQG